MARARASLALAAIVLAASSCSTGEKPAGSDEPPWGLDAIELPKDQPSIEAVFAELPSSMLGLPRNRVDWNDQIGVGWGYPRNEVALVAFLVNDLEPISGPTAPENAGEFLQQVSDSGQLLTVEAEQLDPGGSLVYLVGTLPNGQDARATFGAFFADPGSAFTFVASGDSAATRQALVAAFIGAAKRAGNKEL